MASEGSSAGEDVERMACKGAPTIPNHDRAEHMEECQSCGQQVRADLVDDPFFGFKSGCYSKPEPQNDCSHAEEVYRNGDAYCADCGEML